MQSRHTVITRSVTNTYNHYAAHPAYHVSMNCHVHPSSQSRVTEHESLPCIQHEDKSVWGNGGTDPVILNHSTRLNVGSQLHVPAAQTQTRLPPNHCIGGWVGFWAICIFWRRENIFCLC